MLFIKNTCLWYNRSISNNTPCGVSGGKMSKKKTTLVVAFVAIAVVALGLGAAVYAKYISSIQRTGTATVAKWAFTDDNTAGTVICEFDKTYDSTTLVAGKIAPGTSGKCPIEISNATSEVGIRYDIKLSDAVANKPTNMKFYADAGHQTELTGNTTINGTLNPGAAAVTEYVYWEWPYQDGTTEYDSADTTDGETAASLTMTFDVTGTQLEPTAQP